MGAAENVKAVRASYEAFLRDDIEPMMSLISDDAELINYEGNPFGGRYRGKEGFSDYLANLDLIEMSGLEIESVLGEGDRVVAVIDVDYTVKATNQKAGGLTVHVYDFADDKVIRFREVAAYDGEAWKA